MLTQLFVGYSYLLSEHCDKQGHCNLLVRLRPTCRKAANCNNASLPAPKRGLHGLKTSKLTAAMHPAYLPKKRLSRCTASGMSSTRSSAADSSRLKPEHICNDTTPQQQSARAVNMMCLWITERGAAAVTSALTEGSYRHKETCPATCQPPASTSCGIGLGVVCRGRGRHAGGAVQCRGAWRGRPLQGLYAFWCHQGLCQSLLPAVCISESGQSSKACSRG